MNMPTGSGKTLCSVKFALEKAIAEKKKRIIYVIPFLSVIDQSFEVFENLFGEDAQILRHQSTFSYDDAEDFSEDYRISSRACDRELECRFYCDNYGSVPRLLVFQSAGKTAKGPQYGRCGSHF